MIAKSSLRSCWQGKMGAGVAIVGTLAVGLSESVLAQIVPDNTLGAEGSVVTNVNIKGVESDRIDNGAIRGANLFHSFEEFNVGAGRGAYFSNPAGIENIFSRVTGANRSEILGRLGVLGNANLFLINPRGIVFGSGASLDVQGSFLATTADAVKLGEAGLFSAAQPAASNLLSVSPSAILFNTIAAPPIVNRSRDPGSSRQPNSAGLFPGLQVQSGRTLALIGGNNVLLEGGRLTAAGGRIELGSVAGVGQVSLSQTGNRFVLGYDFINDFGNISLLNRAFVDTSGEGGGDVQIRGARLEMMQNSNMWADTLGAENGGEVLVRTAEVVLSDSSLLSADVAGTGTGGNLTIDTQRLLVSNGAQVTAITRSEGNSGNLQITADAVELIGTLANTQRLSALSANSQGEGDAGSVRIDTRRLLVRDGAVVSGSSIGSGKGGSLQINATDSVELIGRSANDRTGSGLFAQNGGSGIAGDLIIKTGRLLVRDGAEVSGSAFSSGKGGNLEITADAVELSGRSIDSQHPSGLFAQSERAATGDGGNLKIGTGRLLVDNGAQVSVGTLGEGNSGNLEITADTLEVSGTSTDGKDSSSLYSQSEGSGNAGDLKIDTGRLIVRDGAVVSSSTFGKGKGGNLEITATNSVEVTGRSTDGLIGSGLFAQSVRTASGNAGDLKINTGRLQVRDGARISNDTFGTGNSGSLQITATNSVELTSTLADGERPSSLLAQSYGSGSAGNLRIDTGRLLVRDGSVVSSNTSGSGEGGSLQITATNSVELIGTSADRQRSSGLVVQSFGSGNAGNLRIDTSRLLVRDGAQVSVSTFNQGKGGNLEIIAADSVGLIGASADGLRLSGLFAQSVGIESGDAGDLTIKTGRLLVRDGAQVSTGTFGSGKGGGLQINTSDAVEVIGTSTGGRFSSSLGAQSGGSGNAGALTIDTRRLLVRDGAVISSASSEEGTAGDINITARDTLQADNGTITTNTSRSTGGAIAIKAGDIRLINNSDIRTDVDSGADDGGNITLTADSILAFDDSDILAFARDGGGGDITLETPAFFGEDYRPTSGDTDLDNNNRVDINATGAVSGIITIPDVSFIQNSLTELPENQIDTNSLLASSCIVRRNQPTRGSFTVTGTGGLPQRPGDTQMSSFPTIDMETLPSDSTASNFNPNRSWQKGDSIVEPLGVYRLANGKLVLSRECS